MLGVELGWGERGVKEEGKQGANTGRAELMNQTIQVV